MIGGKKKLIAKNSISKNFIKLEFPDIIVSQCEYSEGPCGLTYIFCESGIRVYKEQRGGNNCQLDVLGNGWKNIIRGINISGGASYGLESTCGISAAFLKDKKDFTFSGINGSVIYSHNLRVNKIYPDKKLGKFAYR